VLRIIETRNKFKIVFFAIYGVIFLDVLLHEIGQGPAAWR